MDLMIGLTAINAALDTVKTIRSIEKNFDEASLKLAVAELTSNLAEAKLFLVDAAEEKQSLLAQIEELKASFDFGGGLIEYRGYKFYSNDEGKPTGKPFCQVCERNKGKYFQLTSSRGAIEHTCPNCKSVFHNLPSFN